jgi:mono/diheme cytochrome c family protein
MWTAAVAVVLSIVFALWKPRWMNAGVVALMLFTGLATMAAGEYVREVSRKPYSITGYIYANDLRVAAMQKVSGQGAVEDSPWLSAAVQDPVRYGRQLFVTECAACHSVSGYRAMRTRVSGWDDVFAGNILLHLPLIRGTMPPFAGNEQDRMALGRYLASIGVPPQKVPEAQLGRHVFQTRCALCHTIGGARRPLQLAGMDRETLESLVGSLSDINDSMPPFTGSEAERRALAGYLSSAK